MSDEYLVKHIREEFKNYLNSQVKKEDITQVDANTQWSDADYPRKHAKELGIDYWSCFKNEMSFNNLLSILKEDFKKNGKKTNTIYSYEKALKNFKYFIIKNYGSVENIMKNNTVNYYWVCQGRQKDDKKYIIAPAYDEVYHHKLVNKLKVGDIVISYFNQQIYAVSPVIKATEIITINNEQWYRAVLDYSPLTNPIPKSDITQVYKENNIKPYKYAPFDKNYNYNQGYLFKFSKELLDLILNNTNMGKNKNIIQMPIEHPSGNIPLNQILYGPPGTGKTYSVKEYINKILGNNPGLKKNDETQKYNNIVKDMNWYSVIALAMYVGGKDKKYKVPDIQSQKLLQFFIQTKVNKNINSALWGQLQTHTNPDSVTVHYGTPRVPYLFDKADDSSWFLTQEGKTFIEQNLSDKLELLNAKDGTNTIEDYYRFITFHQSYSYEEFVEGITPVINDDEDESSISYEYNTGIFKEICQKANSDPDNNYLLVIDEINRGNISKIFGELITLIEPDKRVTPNKELNFENTNTDGTQLVVTLPYTKTKFGVPSNLYILGTMNTSDRSIASIDIALRRRFVFKEMMPKTELVADFGVEFKEIFESLNNKIKILLDRDHQIGHSYFINTKYNDENGNNNTDTLKNIWFTEILPLLNEYFYCDWEKLKLIIPGFINKIEVPKTLQQECDGDSFYEFKTPDKIQDFKTALKQEKFE